MREKLYYPLFADLNGRACLVVGGGSIAHQKVRQLLRFGAEVHVVAPELCAPLTGLLRKKRIQFTPREFRAGDLRGVWLVFAATDRQEINQSVYKAATRRRVFCNVVDIKPLCSFIVPAIAKRGLLTVAVSTGGSSPTLAAHVKEELERAIEPYVKPAQLLHELRGIAKQKLPSYADRRRYFGGLLDSPVMALAQAGRKREAKKLALERLRIAAERHS